MHLNLSLKSESEGPVYTTVFGGKVNTFVSFWLSIYTRAMFAFSNKRIPEWKDLKMPLSPYKWEKCNSLKTGLRANVVVGCHVRREVSILMRAS